MLRNTRLNISFNDVIHRKKTLFALLSFSCKRQTADCSSMEFTVSCWCQHIIHIIINHCANCAGMFINLYYHIPFLWLYDKICNHIVGKIVCLRNSVTLQLFIHSVERENMPNLKSYRLEAMVVCDDYCGVSSMYRLQ